MTGTIVTAAPQAAALPWQLPKTQPEWQAFLNSLNSWRPQAPAWQPITLQNSWAAYGTPYASAQYQVDLNGRVWLRGLITGGTITDGTVLATLPYTPSFEIATLALANSGSAYSPVRLDITTSGNVLIYGASAFSGSYFVSLDQLSFSLAQ
jgi:hypothetical protein